MDATKLTGTLDNAILPDNISTDEITIKGSYETGSGSIILNCEQNSHGVTIKGPPHNVNATYTLTLPNTPGNSNQIISTDGNGNLSFIDNNTLQVASSSTLGGIKVGSNLSIDGNGFLSVDNDSDSRIKENIRDIDDKEALNKILALQPKKYEYIDKKERGDISVIGFIAQQVREIIPEAVKINKKIAPNILNWYDYEYGKIFINIPDIKIGTEINFRYNDENDNETGQTLKIKEIYDDYVELDDEDGMKSIPENIDKVYVYGYELDDFHTLDKNMIFSTNVSATQELHKIIMEQKEEISLLKDILTRNGIV